MNNFPEAAYIILATGLTTIVTTALTQGLVARAESKKAAREAAQQMQKRQTEWHSKQREIKSSKLAELWLAVELAKERISDAELEYRPNEQILPPRAKEMAGSATSAAYGIALLHFPEMRPLVYALHVGIVKYEAALWFHQPADLDAISDLVSTIRTELADAVERTARDMQQPPL